MVVETADERAHKSRGLLLGAQHGAPVFLGHLHTLWERVDAPGIDQGRHRVGEQSVKALPAPLFTHAADIGSLCQSHHQQALGVKMLKKAGQRKSGAVYVQGPQRDILVVLSLVEELQVEFLDDLAQTDAVLGLCHRVHPSPIFWFWISIAHFHPARKRTAVFSCPILHRQEMLPSPFSSKLPERARKISRGGRPQAAPALPLLRISGVFEKNSCIFTQHLVLYQSMLL